MAVKPTINYEALAQDAMRGVVKSALAIAAQGLPGDHHFYISFDTRALGVTLSKRLRERYPKEMTIVLQHRFWDLLVSDDRFEVKLTFDGIPERIVIPFQAVKVFVDPSVRYGLQFDSPADEADAPADRHSLTMDAAYDSVSTVTDDAPRPVVKRAKSTRKPKADKENRQDGAPSVERPAKKPAAEAKPEQPAAQGAEQDLAPMVPEENKPSSGAQIVSLDAFRKK